MQSKILAIFHPFLHISLSIVSFRHCSAIYRRSLELILKIMPTKVISFFTQVHASYFIFIFILVYELMNFKVNFWGVVNMCMILSVSAQKVGYIL